jgi:hypothetical protein
MSCYFTYIDEFHLTDLSVERSVIGKPFRWKGGEWSTKLDAKTTGDISIYLGFETLAALPDGFCEPLEYKYSLMTMENVVLCSGK